MFMIVVYLLSVLITPAPLVSMTVDPQAYPDRLDVVVHLLSSDARYTEYAIDVGGIGTPVRAPLSALQMITTTLPLDLPPLCNAKVVYSFVVTARVLTDTLPFARTEVGGLAVRQCPYHAYVP